MKVSTSLDSASLAALVLLGATCTAAGQHYHANAGAATQSVGSPLIFANRASIDADARFLVHLDPTESPFYGFIFYGGSELTFTSLAGTLDNGGPHPKAALPGTRVAAVVETVSGPEGGLFSFWDSFDGFFDATEITFTVPAATRNGTNRFLLSENDGTSGSDPYGHIHGRKFSANLPGLYRVGVRLMDIGNNGPGNGPQHTPSDLVFFLFQAGTSISRISNQDGKLTLEFGTETEKTYFIEHSDGLIPERPWTTVAGPIEGTGRLEAVSELSAELTRGFFRLRVE